MEPVEVQCQIYGSAIGLSGPQSQDDDEDSSPLQDLNLADHVPCSNRDMTTFGHINHKPLTHLGFIMATLVGQCQLTGNTKSCTADRQIRVINCYKFNDDCIKRTAEPDDERTPPLR